MSGYPKCATCKHWVGWEPMRWGASKIIPVLNEGYTDDDQTFTPLDVKAHNWGECTAPQTPRGDGFSVKMQVWDASSYAASLTTRDDFGCIEHECGCPRNEHNLVTCKCEGFIGT